MLKDHLKPEISKSDMAQKVQAWQEINKVLVKANANFMQGLNEMLKTKEAEHKALQEKLEKGEGTEEENATFIFLGGYIQCLKDILTAKKAQ